MIKSGIFAKTTFQKLIMYAYMNKKFSMTFIQGFIYNHVNTYICYECAMSDLQGLKNASLGGHI